ncbi:MAG TPA: hypothetical protein VF323_02775 [Candidatus Limnocylindrales bacterium]
MAGDWRTVPDTVEPTVLVLGGFLTSPPLYLRLERRLLERGAAHVVVAPVWLPDWLLAAGRDMGPILTRSGRALLRACAVAEGSARSTGAPLLVVGHSAGGMTARLLTSPEPYAGRRFGAAGRIGAIVTLGTPHRVTPTGLAGGRLANAAMTFADRVVPGPAFAPTTGYLAVASRSVVGRADGDRRGRVAYGLYRSIHADAGADARGASVPGPSGAILGDGLVPVASALLPGVESIVLDGIAHGQGRHGPWYGSDEALDVWWPRAVEIWRDALRARIARAADGAASRSRSPRSAPSERRVVY